MSLFVVGIIRNTHFVGRIQYILKGSDDGV
jgi:hypothetical protein